MTALPVVIALLAGLTTAPATDPWNVDLSQPVSVGEMSRMDNSRISVYPPHTLARPANRFTVAVDGSAEVDVRGVQPDGDWTEWTQAPAVLAAPTRSVQVRVVYRDTAPRALTVYPS